MVNMTTRSLSGGVSFVQAVQARVDYVDWLTCQSTQTVHAIFPYITTLFLFCGLSGLKIEAKLYENHMQ